MGYSYNHVTLVGRLTRDPEWIQVSESLGRATFTLAVQRGFRKEDKKKEVDFIPITVWGKVGYAATTLLKKGVPVLVWGRVQIKSYLVESKRHWGVEIVAENFQILQARAIEAVEVESEAEM